MNGKLIYKRWLKTGNSKVFDVMAYDKYTLQSITEEDIEISQDVIDYLVKNYTYLMTLQESAAMKNFLLDAQLQVYQPTSQEYIERVNALKINSTEIKRLMADGPDKFKLNWVKRILQTQADKIVFNRCKVCGGLARTPQAKQCRFCGNQWHNG